MRWRERPVPRLLALALGCALLLTVAACGDDGNEKGDGGNGAAESASSTAGSETSQSDAQGTTYANDEFGFSVTYDPQRFGVFEEMPEGSGYGVLILDESEGSGPAAVRISVAPAAGAQATYEPGSGEAMTLLRDQFDGIREDLSGADYGAPEECTLGGLPALCAEVEGAIPALPIEGETLTGRLYGTVWGGSTMLVFIGAPTSTWGEAEGPLVQVVDSIKIAGD